ncbi:hypothetical protein, partial [Serratia marcescens]|uniref:hypothetical protein n=1 Tax=Serratia marcescens TaxID=615 RepID=UPI001953DEB7
TDVFTALMASSNQSAPQDRVTGSAGAVTSKPEISAGHPIAKAFRFINPRNTGASMRRQSYIAHK